MKVQRFITATGFFIIILAATACKDSSPVTPAKSKTDLLTQTSWQIQKVYDISSSPGQKIDITSQMPYVYETFNKDGTVYTSVMNGTWEFINQETQILLNKGTSSQLTLDILELTETVFHFKANIPSDNGITVWEMISYPAKISGDRSPVANFDTLWNQYNVRYSFFDLKHIDWTALYNIYKPQVTATTTDLDLFKIISSMLSNLKDGHVNFITPYGNYAYMDWYKKYPQNFLGLNAVIPYMSTDFGNTANGYMHYGIISNDIGYVYVGPNFQGNSNTWSSSIDQIIAALKDTRGIIVDIRNNGGGSDNLANIVAGRFADRNRTFCYYRWKNISANHSDFTDFIPMTIAPQGVRQFTKPVILLTNRHVFSSAEEAVLMFKSFPQVKCIGDTTGGGSGNPIILQLPNGWTYWVPRWIMYTTAKETYENIGLAPDIYARITAADSIAGKDVILERAIQELKKQ